MSYEVVAYIHLKGAGVTSISDSFQPFVEKVNIIPCISASSSVVWQYKLGPLLNKFRHIFCCT